MVEPKTLITEYLRTLSGRAKTPEIVQQYVTDERLARHISETEAAFPGYEIIIQDVLADGAKVAVRGEFRGVHRGEFLGIEATGQSVSAGLIIIYAVADGRIIDHWMQFDLFTLLDQLKSGSAATVA